MHELLISGNRKRSKTPKGVVHLHFDKTPFVEENNRVVLNRSVVDVEGRWGRGFSPTANTGLVRTTLEPMTLTQSFTLEFQARKGTASSLPSNQYLALLYDSVAATGIGIQYYNARFYIYDTTSAQKWVGGDNGLSLDQEWRHHALVYNNGNYKFFRAGVKIADFAGTCNFPTTRGIDFYMGGHATINISATGLAFDEALFTPGVAKYTENFTPPDQPFYSA